MKKERNRNKDLKYTSFIQLTAGISIIILLNFIGTFIFTRFDLTSEKRFSLAPSTKALLKETDDIIYFKIYLEGDLPAGFQKLRQSTKEMLDEFRAYNDNIQYEFIDPAASQDSKKRREIFNRLVNEGLTPTDITVKKKQGQEQQSIFPGALVNSKGRTLPLLLLSNQLGSSPDQIINNSIQSLEYNISNAIRQLTTNNKQSIAFVQGHGELTQLETADIAEALSAYYNVEYTQLEYISEKLAEESENQLGKLSVANKYNTLIIAKPTLPFEEKDKYQIDQFVMRGGKILWLIDPVFASMDSLQLATETVGIAQDLNLDDQLFKYGVRLNTNLLMDLASLPIPMVTGYMGSQPQFEFFPWPFFPVLTPGSSHPVVKNINAIRTEFISNLDTVGKASIKKTILLNTSQYTQIVQTPAIIDLGILGKEPNSGDYSSPNQSVAVLLEGSFESVFTNRSLDDISVFNKTAFVPRSTDNKMIVMSDGDIIKNQIQTSEGQYIPLPLGYDRHTGQTFGNKELILNSINYLNDDTGLMSVRSRELKIRMLDKKKALDDQLGWQLLNILLPIALVILFGIIQFAIRKRRFSK